MATTSDVINLACIRDGCTWESGMAAQQETARRLYTHLATDHDHCSGDHDGMLQHLVDEWGLRGVMSKLVKNLKREEALQVMHLALSEFAGPHASLEEPEEVMQGIDFFHKNLTLVPNTEMQDHMASQLFRCWLIMQERSAKYDEAWYARGALMNMAEMAKKMDRIWAVWWDFDGPPYEERDTDDVVDLINYGLAFLTQASLEEWHGRQARP